MGVITLGQKHGGTNVDGMTPEAAQELAFEFHPLYPLGVLRDFDRRVDLTQLKLDLVADTQIKMHFLRFTDSGSREIGPCPDPPTGPYAPR